MITPAYEESAVTVMYDPVVTANRNNIVYLPLRTAKQPLHPVFLAFKRFFDIALSLIGAVFALIPMMLVAVCIKLDSKGPVFYKQERLGLNGKPFMVYKFRSMRVDAEKDGARWASANDDRVTRVGRILRETRLDEVPQLWNIFKGDMTIVGPRPERAVFYDKFERTVPGFRQRLVVKPGLTGLAQVNGGYDLKPAEKIVYDREYIRKQSLLLDLKCIIKTVAIVFNHNGAR